MEGETTDIADIDRRHVEAFIADQLAQHPAATASVRYKSLQQLFRWAYEEDEIDSNPIAKMSPPDVTDQPVPVVSDQTIVALLRDCDGRDLTSRRDNALIRTFVDTGARLEGIVNLTVDAVDLDAQLAEIILKGRREHEVPFGAKTAQALDRHLRARRRHPRAELPHLWLGPQAGSPSPVSHRYSSAAASGSAFPPIAGRYPIPLAASHLGMLAAQPGRPQPVERADDVVHDLPPHGGQVGRAHPWELSGRAVSRDAARRRRHHRSPMDSPRV